MDKRVALARRIRGRARSINAIAAWTEGISEEKLAEANEYVNWLIQLSNRLVYYHNKSHTNRIYKEVYNEFMQVPKTIGEDCKLFFGFTLPKRATQEAIIQGLQKKLKTDMTPRDKNCIVKQIEKHVMAQAVKEKLHKQTRERRTAEIRDRLMREMIECDNKDYYTVLIPWCHISF